MGLISINIDTDVKELLVDSVASTNVYSVVAAVKLSDGKNQECSEREIERESCFEFEITPNPSHLSWADRSQAVITS